MKKERQKQTIESVSNLFKFKPIEREAEGERQGPKVIPIRHGKKNKKRISAWKDMLTVDCRISEMR
jgi:hypothetical protein